jgi:uncharacterized protein with HEPN domain
MSSYERQLEDYLKHIIEAIEQIHSYTEAMDLDAFLGNRLVQDAVIRNIEIIGEASNVIQKRYPDFAESNPSLPLQVAYQMRNSLAHGYFNVNQKIVWRTTTDDLPKLHDQLTQILWDMNSDKGSGSQRHKKSKDDGPK